MKELLKNLLGPAGIPAGPSYHLNDLSELRAGRMVTRRRKFTRGRERKVPQWDRPLPLYVQVKQALVERIQAGVYAVGEKLPTEAELAKEFGVSPATVKQTINALAAEGIVIRRPSQGTFVAGLNPEPGAVPLRSFTEVMRERGIPINTRLLITEIRPAGAKVAWQLDTGAGEPVLYLRRLRSAGDRPLAMEETFLPIDLLPELAEAGKAAEFAALAEGSLYRLLEEGYGLGLLGAEETIWAEAAGADEAAALGIEPGAPVLVAERVTEVSGHRRGFLSRTVFRADAYLLKFRLSRYARRETKETKGETRGGWGGR